MFKKFILLFVLFCTIISSTITVGSKAYAESRLDITAEGAVLMDLVTGQILYSKNMDQKCAPASTTKIITALITLEKCQLTDKVIVGKKPPFEDGSKIYLIEGEELTVEQLLYALLLESANDSALALAEHISGSKEEFAKLMNQKALEIGCKNTNFANPNGLYEENHYTTALDLALISKKAMENETFRKIVSTVSYQIPPTNKQPETRYFHNHNKFIKYKSKYPGVDGVKTGYTDKARHSFVGSVTRGNRKLLAVVLKDEQPPYDDVMKLFDYGFNNFNYEKIISKDDLIENIKVSGSNTEIPICANEDFYLSFLKGKNNDYSRKLLLNSIPSHIKKGDSLGFLEISTPDGFKINMPVVSGTDYSSAIYDLKKNENGSFKAVIKYKSFIIPSIAILCILLFSFIRLKKNRSFK